MKWIKYVVLVLFIAWALWQAEQIHELRTSVNQVGEQIDALQEQQDALRVQVVEVSRIAIKPQSIAIEFEPNPNIPLSAELQEHTINEADRIGVDPSILFALIHRESRYQIDAWCMDTNGYESVGLCQINGMAYDFLSDRGIDPHTPEGNITAAAELIGYYLERYTLEESLAAYGAGEGGMLNGNGFTAARKLIVDSGVDV